MTNEEQKRIFSKNLRKYVAESGKQQKEIAEAIGVNPTTFNMWYTGKAIPGTGKLGTLAKYFRVGLSDLVNEKEEKELDAEYSDVAMKIGLTDNRSKATSNTKFVVMNVPCKSAVTTMLIFTRKVGESINVIVDSL